MAFVIILYFSNGILIGVVGVNVDDLLSTEFIYCVCGLTCSTIAEKTCVFAPREALLSLLRSQSESCRWTATRTDEGLASGVQSVDEPSLPFHLQLHLHVRSHLRLRLHLRLHFHVHLNLYMYFYFCFTSE